VDLEDIVPDVIGHIHEPGRIEDDAVTGALAGEADEDGGDAIGRHFADGLLLLEVDGVDVAVLVAVGSLDASGPDAFREGRGDEEFFFFTGDSWGGEEEGKKRQGAHGWDLWVACRS